MNPANFITLPAILAEGAATPAPNPFGGMSLIIPMILIYAILYFVLIRPGRLKQKKEQQQLEEFRNNMSKGDKVITVGGMHGMVSGTTEKTVSVKIADGLSVKFDRSAIITVIDSKTKNDDEASSE